MTTAGRPAGRPLILFGCLFLWNGMTNSRTFILIRCHHPINHVFDRHGYPPAPATARGTCRGRGCRRHPLHRYLHDGWPGCVKVWRVLRDQLAITFTQVRGGVNLHVRMCIPLFHISQTAGRIAFKFCVTTDPFDKCFTHVWGGLLLHVRTCTHFSISRKRLGGLRSNLVCG